MVSRPHRACPGGAMASAQATACAGPRPHRACPGGAKASAPEGRFATAPCLVQKPPLHRDKLGGGGARRASLLVQKPPLHRDKLGGGGTGRRLEIPRKSSQKRFASYMIAC